MALYFQVSGRPLAIRKVEWKDEEVIAFDFLEESLGQPPKDLPIPSTISATALLNKKQWNRILKTLQYNSETIESANKFLIKGEIVTGLENDISTSEIVFVGFEVQYIPKKEGDNSPLPPIQAAKEIFAQKESKVKKLVIKAPKPQKKDELSEEHILLHKQQNGVCQKCGQRCDVRVMYMVEEETKTLVCADCFVDNPKLNVYIPKDILHQFMYRTGWDEEKAREFLTSFPSKYALTFVGAQFRWYWSWDKENSPISQINFTSDGTVKSLVYYELSWLKPIPQPKKEKDIVEINRKQYRLLSVENVHMAQINVPRDFLKPHDMKVKAKMDYYNEHQKFDSPIVVLKKGEELVLLDGYAKYMAAKKLNLLTLEAHIVSAPQKVRR